MVGTVPRVGSHQSLLPTVFDDRSELTHLPKDCELWPLDQKHSACGTGNSLHNVQSSLKAATSHGPWTWPDRPVVFISDLHADAEGFLRSLVAAGTIRRFGPSENEFELTPFGQKVQIVIGGDCLDKGPSNLDLLDAVSTLLETGADVHLLAGNHDLRLFVALAALDLPRTPLTEHLFVRMARKAIPLLREIWNRFDLNEMLDAAPDEATCRARLFPGNDWFERFPEAATGYMPAQAVQKELRKMREKIDSFDSAVATSGLTMRQAYTSVMYCQTLFLDEAGAYTWFYQKMKAMKRVGSLLFVHAGICDSMSHLLSTNSPDVVNQKFLQDALLDPFRFYTGEVANLVRTKYRRTDKQLTADGVQALYRTGIKMVVQGHVNNHAGQRLLAKNGLLHLEGDVTIDRASRAHEGLAGIGVGATLIYPSGDVVGLSVDYPRAKHFKPEIFGG